MLPHVALRFSPRKLLHDRGGIKESLPLVEANEFVLWRVMSEG